MKPNKKGKLVIRKDSNDITQGASKDRDTTPKTRDAIAVAKLKDVFLKDKEILDTQRRKAWTFKRRQQILIEIPLK